MRQTKLTDFQIKRQSARSRRRSSTPTDQRLDAPNPQPTPAPTPAPLTPTPHPNTKWRNRKTYLQGLEADREAPKPPQGTRGGTSYTSMQPSVRSQSKRKPKPKSQGRSARSTAMREGIQRTRQSVMSEWFRTVNPQRGKEPTIGTSKDGPTPITHAQPATQGRDPQGVRHQIALERGSADERTHDKHGRDGCREEKGESKSPGATTTPAQGIRERQGETTEARTDQVPGDRRDTPALQELSQSRGGAEDGRADLPNLCE